MSSDSKIIILLQLLIFFFITLQTVTVPYYEQRNARTPVEFDRKIESNDSSTGRTETKAYNITFTNRNLACLSEAIYQEAGFESQAGREAVGLVIMNRAEQRGTIDLCAVIHESKMVDGKRVCQFSYYCMQRKTPIDGAVFAESMFTAICLLTNRFDLNSHMFQYKATHYHADYIKPPIWTRQMEFLGKIGTHLFYREKS